MNNAIQLFNYEDHDMQVIEIDGEPWIVAKDVCDILEIKNSRDALRGIDEEDLTSVEATSGGQRRQMNAVNESGFYALIFKSRKPGAKKFKRWVTSEVLPTIRKTGGYAMPGKGSTEAVMERAFTMLENIFHMMEKTFERMMEQNKALEPKPRRKITTEERDTILQMSRDGFDPTPIGDALEIKPASVSSILSRARQTGEID